MSFWSLNPFSAFRRMSEAGEVAAFYRSFAATHSAGLPLAQSLDLLETGAATQARAQALKASLARGGTLKTGARPPAFTALETGLLALGEESGALDATLKGLAAFFEADMRVARQVKTKIMQPFMTLLAACFILPLPLAFGYGLHTYLATSLPLFFALMLFSGAVLASLFTFIRGRPRYAISRMLWALAIALEAGLNIERAVQLAADALGPCRTATLMRAVPVTTWHSAPLSKTLPAICQLPRMTVAVLENMERTGDTGSTLRWLAKNYEDGTISTGP